MIDASALKLISSERMAKNYATMQPDIRFFWKKGDIYSIWRTWEEMNNRQRATYNYRQILRCEIVFDFEDKVSAEKVIPFLKTEGLTFLLWDTGGKGQHLHLVFDRDLEPEEKLAFLQHYCKIAGVTADESACKAIRLIGLENAPHRNTGKTKTLLEVFNGKSDFNSYPDFIKVEKKPKVFTTKTAFVLPTKKCLFLNYALENALPKDTNRNGNVVPNFVAAYTQEQEAWQQFCNVQGKKILELENWSKRKPQFNCKQLRKYSQSIKKAKFCDLCLLAGEKK